MSECAKFYFVDFPGTGEDEISFHRGEIIVVIAKDDGFGDGWWTVIPLPPKLHFARIHSFHVSLIFIISFFARRIRVSSTWLCGGGVRWVIKELHMHTLKPTGVSERSDLLPCPPRIGCGVGERGNTY